jgi:hypothetical protein
VVLRRNGTSIATIKTSDSFRCDLIVRVAALPQTSNLGAGGSNPSERANKTYQQIMPSGCPPCIMGSAGTGNQLATTAAFF